MLMFGKLIVRRWFMYRMFTYSIATGAVVAFTIGSALAFGDCVKGKHQQSVKAEAPVTTAQTPTPKPRPKTGS